MALPVFRAAGAKANDTTNAVAVLAPTGVATGDLEILIAECPTAATVSITANGGGAWTAVTGTPITVTAGEKLYVWYRVRAGGDSNPSVQASADHVCAGRLAYQTGTFNTIDPLEVETTGTHTTSNTTFSFAPGVSTAGTDRLVLCISSILRDSNVASVPVCTNASLSALASRLNICTNSGLGGGFGVTEGARAAAGSVGTFACTYAAASTKSMIAFAIKPLVSLTLTADVGTFAHTGIAADLKQTHIMTADVGAFVLTGNAADLDVVTPSSDFLWQEHTTGVDSYWGALPGIGSSSCPSQKVKGKHAEDISISRMSVYLDRHGVATSLYIVISSGVRGTGTVYGTSDNLVWDSSYAAGTMELLDVLFSTPAVVPAGLDFWFTVALNSGLTRLYASYNPSDQYRPGDSYDIDVAGVNDPVVSTYITDIGFKIYTVAEALNYLINEDFERPGTPMGFLAGAEFDETVLVLNGSQSLKIYDDGTVYYTIANYPSAVGEVAEAWFKMRMRIQTYPAAGYIVGLTLMDESFNQCGSVSWHDTEEVSVDFSNWLTFNANTNYYLWMHYEQGVGFEIWWHTTNSRAAAVTAGNHLSIATATYPFAWLQFHPYGTGAEYLIDDVKIAEFDFESLGGGGVFTLTADVGAFTLTGNAASLLRSLKLTADVGAFALTGNIADLRWTQKITADVGAFALTGNAAGLLRARRLTADVGAFALTGNVALLQQTHIMAADVGTFALTGNAATLRFHNNLLTNLIAHWKLNEASGQRDDSHVGALHLSESGLVTSDTGKIGNAAYNGAAGDRLYRDYNTFIVESIDLGSDDDFTICGWYKSESDPINTDKFLFGKGGVGDAAVEYALWFQNGDNGLTFKIGNGTTSGFVFAGSSGGTGWHFFVAWHDKTANKIRLQVDNGTVVESNWADGTWSAGASELGFFRDMAGGTGEQFSGLADEFAFFRRVLSANDRGALWNGGAGLPYESFTATGGGVFTLTANTGSFVLTGNDAILARRLTLTAAAGAFALTGNDASLRQTQILTSETGAFVLTGNAATLIPVRKLTAATGAFALTGNVADLRQTSILRSDAGPFTYTGNNNNFLLNQRLTCAAGAFVLTGNAAPLSAGKNLVAGTGAFALAGQDVAFRLNQVVTAAAGSFALTGNAAGLARSFTLTASSGAFVLTGNAAALRQTHIGVSATGAFVLTGNDAGKVRAYVLAAGTGSFALTGNDATLVWAEEDTLIATVGVFLLTGNDAILAQTSILGAAAGTFTLTGNSATLRRGSSLTSATGSFILTGNDVAWLRSYVLSAAAGTFILTGNDATLAYGAVGSLPATVGVFLLTGSDAGLRVNRILPALTKQFLLSGKAADLRHAQVLAAGLGQFVLTGGDAKLFYAGGGVPVTPFFPVHEAVLEGSGIGGGFI